MSTVATTRAKLPSMSDAALAWTIADLREVIRVQNSFEPGGAPKYGEYLDELQECLAERNRRAGKPRCRCCGRPL
jgi:hypothetical protein